MASNKIVVITGASSGIGFSTAELFLKRGYKVFNLSRSKAPNEQIISIKCDVGDDNSVALATQKIIDNEDKIDLLVLNAGYGISGPVEETKIENAIQQFNINFFGTVRVVNSMLPLLRKSSSGRIIIVSSLAAVFPIPFQTFYSASKAALVNYARALETELSPFKIKIITILPGDIKTSFTERRQKFSSSSLYQKHAENAVKIMENDETKGMSPTKIAQLIDKVSRIKHPRKMYTAGIKYKFVCFLAKILSAKTIDKIIKKIYS